MKIAVVAVLLILVAGSCAQSSLASLLTYERLRETIFNFSRPHASYKTRHLQRASMLQKLQETQYRPFPCETAGARSPVRPQSVHRLRPGDIDVIGAMGDSLTASYGNTALNLLQVFVENRGISWSGGGEGTWNEYLTLPNILKEFNPNLVGYSYNDSLSHQRASQFNVAEGAAMSPDMPFQAKLVLRRMRGDSRVDLQNDWKLLTLMIGPNDFCYEMCFTETKAMLERHRAELVRTLDYLQENLPRTLVNLVPSPNLKIIMNFTGKPLHCELVNDVECPCIFGLRFRHRRKEFVDVMEQWRAIDKEVAESGRYKTTDHFAVVLQPFTMDAELSTVDSAQGRVMDLSYLSQDCFHFSQKGNARASNALWNNMMEPVGQKCRRWDDIFSRFLCPTEQSPYIYTGGNSG